MGLITYKQKNEIEEYEKIFYNNLTKNLPNHRNIKLKNQNSLYLNIVQYFSFSHSVWFARYLKENEIIYYFGDKNQQSTLNGDNISTIKPNFSIIFNLEKFRKGNGRFASDDDKNYILLLVELESVQLANLIRAHFPLIKLRVKNSDKTKYFFKFDLNTIIFELDLIIKNIEFQDPFSNILKIKSMDYYGLIENKPSTNKINKESNVENGKKVEITEINNSDNEYITCNICGKKLRKNLFYKFSNGNYRKICKKCSEKKTAAKYLKEILQYVQPNEIINPDELKDKYSLEKLNENINTFLENDLVKKNKQTGLYKLESSYVINDFLEKYGSKENTAKHNLINENESYNKILKQNSENEEENIPPKKSNGQYSFYTGVSYNRVAHKWFAHHTKNKKMKIIGYFQTEEEAHEAREKYIENLYEKTGNNEPKKYKNEPQKKPNGQYSNHKGVGYNKAIHKWYAYVYENKKMKVIGKYDTEEEAFQSRQNYLNNDNPQKISSMPQMINDLKIKDSKTDKNSKIDYFVNYLGDQSEILMRGTLKNEDAFKFVTELTPINSEIKKVLIDNNETDTDIIVEIKLKRYNLTYITDFLKKLGCTQKNLS